MTELREGDLRIMINDDVLNARKFDDPTSHGLSHCMKAVDFVVELVEPLSVYRNQGPAGPSSSIPRAERFCSRIPKRPD